MVCPNISSPEWKRLVSEVGEDAAYQMYYANDNQIPSVINEPMIKKDFWGKTVFSAIHTFRKLNQAPQVAKQIVDKLKNLYPDVIIFKDGLFDKDGNWVEIEPGKVGQHTRNAFVSAVAWANDSYLETPPHEYAHHYIDMFRNHPLVQEGLAKYGEERLVTIMGRYFANKEISKNTKNWIQQFWDMIKDFFGNNDVADILSKKFYNGEMLGGEVFKGSGIIQNQSSEDELYKKWDNFLELGKNFQSDNIEILNNNASRILLNNDFKDTYTDTSLLFVEGDIIHYDKFKQSVMVYLSSLINTKFENVRGLDDKTLKSAISKISTDLTDSQITELVLKIRDNVDIKDIEVSRLYALLVKAKKGENYNKHYKDKIITGNKQGIDKNHVIDSIENEIETHITKRDALYKKYVKNPTAIKYFKAANKFMRGFINARLVGKFLSGDFNSTLSKLFYQQFNQAESKRLTILNGFEDIMSGEFKTLKDGSIWQKGIKNIQDVEHIDITAKDDKGSTINTKISSAEAINLYLMLRQDTVITDVSAISPKEALMRDGFVLENLTDRELPSMRTIIMDEQLADQITKYVEGNFQDYISKLDEAMDYMYTNVNETYSNEMGFELDKIKHYFPVYHKGSEDVKGTVRSLMNEFRSTAAREGGGKAIKIGDVTQILNNYKNTASMYSSYSIAIENNKKVLSSIKSKFGGENTNVEHYLKAWEDQIKRLDNRQVIFPTSIDGGMEAGFNRLLNNFSVSVLAYNPAVMLKQTISYMAASNYIDSKYLRKIGWGVGGFVGINPKDVLKWMKYTGVKEGSSNLPLEWKLDLNDPIIKEMMDNSSKLKYRMKGATSREMGELLTQAGNSDIVSVKIRGKSIQMSKTRMMMGITMLDTATIKAIWEAVRLEAVDKGYSVGSKEFLEYVAKRTEYIVDNTQPTFDLINRAELSQISHSVARTITMFSSATSKLGMIVIDKISDYLNNPTPEKKKAMVKSMVSTMVYTSIGIATIDLMKNLLIYGWDDDDEEKTFKAWQTSMITNTMTPFFGAGLIARGLATRMDNNSWSSVTQHPAESLIDNVLTGSASVLSGDIDKGIIKLSNAIFNAKGLPVQLINLPNQVYKGRVAE